MTRSTRRHHEPDAITSHQTHNQTPIERILVPVRTTLAKLAGTLIFAFVSMAALAEDPAVFATKNGALRGVDVVAYYSLDPKARAVKGDASITHDYMGATYRFSSVENRDRFAANPAQYAPQFGGYCAFAVSHGFTKPVDPNRWNIVDGKLYINLNGSAERKWLKDRDNAIERGHANWPDVLTACEARDNCAQPPKGSRT